MGLKARIYDDLKCVIPRVWRWITARQWRVVAAVAVVIAPVSFVGGAWFSSNTAQEKFLESERARNAAQEKLLVSQGEREEQEKNFEREREERAIKSEQERQERAMKYAQEQKEFLETPRWSQ
jgi:hypothetical protein